MICATPMYQRYADKWLVSRQLSHPSVRLESRSPHSEQDGEKDRKDVQSPTRFHTDLTAQEGTVPPASSSLLSSISDHRNPVLSGLKAAPISVPG